KRKPLSDQKLCDLMAREGCNLARRTVAKYRDQLRIPGTTGRKEYPPHVFLHHKVSRFAGTLSKRSANSPQIPRENL
ncbi:MAG: hypothetical protein RR502_10490, partial [Oscillospiraceae bacterium]